MDQVNDDEKWSSASLCIGSKKRSVDEISKFLDTKSDQAISKGESLSKRNPKSPISKEHRWTLNSKSPSFKPLENHLEEIASYIESHKSAIQELLSDCDLEIRCAFSSGNGQGGFFLDSALLKKLAANSIDIVVDLYPPEGNI